MRARVPAGYAHPGSWTLACPLCSLHLRMLQAARSPFTARHALPDTWDETCPLRCLLLCMQAMVDSAFSTRLLPVHLSPCCSST